MELMRIARSDTSSSLVAQDARRLLQQQQQQQQKLLMYAVGVWRRDCGERGRQVESIAAFKETPRAYSDLEIAY